MLRNWIFVGTIIVAGACPLVARAQDKPKEAPKEEAPKEEEPKKEAPPKALTDADVKTKLGTQKVTFAFNKTPLADAIDFLGDITGISVVADPEVVLVKTLSLEVRDTKLETALDAVSGGAKVKFEVWHGLLWIAPAKGGQKVPPRADPTDELKKVQDGQILTLHLDETPLSEVLELLTTLTKIDFALDKSLDGENKVTFSVKNATLATVIDVICRTQGLKLVNKSGKNTFKPM